MSISAINCTPIKPQVAFNGRYDDFEDLNELSEFNEKYVKSDDIKKPVAVAASVALAGLASYAGAKALTNKITSYKFASNAGALIETGLKTAANTVKNSADTFSKITPEKKLSVDTAKKYLGKAVLTVEEGARNLYKKVAYSNIPKETVNPERANKALANVAGAGASTATVAEICTRDSDGDGVVDIMQKSQNAYAKSVDKYNGAVDTLDMISSAVKMFT